MRPVPKDALRVMGAILINVTLYSRLEDKVAVSRLAADSGIPPHKVTVALKWLREHHLIERPPTQGGRSSTGKGYAGKIRVLDDMEAKRREQEATILSRMPESVVISN